MSKCRFNTNVYRNTLELYGGSEPVYQSNDMSNLVIMLSTDPVIIFDYVGLDYSRFQRGFANQIELFEFLESCKFYDSKSKFDSNLADRKHLEKRPVYNAFVTRSSRIKDSAYIFNNDSKFQNQLSHILHFGKTQLLDEKIHRDMVEKQRSLKIDWVYHLNQFPNEKKGFVKSETIRIIIRCLNLVDIDGFNKWLDSNDKDVVNIVLESTIESVKKLII